MSNEDLKDYENIINPKDFSSIEFNFTEFMNTTSSTPVVPLDSIEFLEFENNIIYLDLPQKCGRIAHYFSFKAEVSNPKEKKPLKFAATFKLIDLEETGSSRIRAKCELMQYEEKDWQAVTNMYAKRQEELTHFLLNARGIADI